MTQLPRIIFAFAVVITLILGYFIPGSRIIIFPYNLFGSVVIVLGFLLMFWSANIFNSRKTTIHPIGTPNLLVTEGSYRFSRNPMYLGNLLILIGSAIILGTLTYFLGPIIFFLGINQIVIPYEEQKLRNIFKSDYMDYKKKVRRWI